MIQRAVDTQTLRKSKWQSLAGRSTTHSSFYIYDTYIFRGKGLGKKEDGITKHIKVEKKEENSGVSCFQ